jgi:hypothetical protein
MLEAVLVSLIIGIIIGGLLLYLILKPGQMALPRASTSPTFSEKEAENILKNNGYQLISRQPRKNIITHFQGQNHLSYSEADYLVKREKKKYLVIVKAGEGEVDPNEPGLRQRLLINDYAFAPDGLLLLSAATGDLQPVSFEFPKARSIDSFFRWFMIIFIILCVIGIIWLTAYLRLV